MGPHVAAAAALVLSAVMVTDAAVQMSRQQAPSQVQSAAGSTPTAADRHSCPGRTTKQVCVCQRQSTRYRALHRPIVRWYAAINVLTFVQHSVQLVLTCSVLELHS
eukprot:m.400003 g.400003  ORF g.400003 m.400003 type:complete len:106 (-) comp20113_c1_seq91:1692-2009(-)